MSNRSVLLFLLVSTPVSAAYSREFKSEFAYPMISEDICANRKGEVYKNNRVTYCKIPVKIPKDACEVLYALDVSRPANSDVPRRKEAIESFARTPASYIRADAKRGILGERTALMSQGFARQNPSAWDFEQGFVPAETGQASPMQSAYRYYLTWLEKSCLANRVDQPDP